MTRWGQHENPSSHWTIELSEKWYLLILGVLTLVHFFLAGVLPPTEDELYYWTWSKKLGLSYYDHPPMVAYWIALSTKIFGDTLWGIRFFAVIVSSVTILLVGALLEKKTLLGFLFFTPLFFFGAVLMTPDIPLVLFWTLYLLWTIRVSQTVCAWTEDPVSRVYRKFPVTLLQWALGGILLGLGLLSKYTMAMAPLCLALFFIFRVRLQAWWFGFICHLVIAFLIALPILIFNWDHDFASLRYQWSHGLESSGLSLHNFFQFLGSQIALIGALPFLLLPWVLLLFFDIARQPRLAVCLYFFLFPLIFFLLNSFRTFQEGNWGLITYIAFWPLAQHWLDSTSFKMEARILVGVCFILPMAICALGVVHLAHPLSWVPPERDRIAKFTSQRDLAVEAAKIVRDPPLPLFATSYQWASYFSFLGVNATQIPREGKPSQFTLAAKDPCSFDEIWSFRETIYSPPSLQCFTREVSRIDLPLLARGSELTRFSVVRLAK